MDREAVERLFAAGRDPGERVRDDDWFPVADEGARSVYACESVAQRRRWYVALLEDGRL